MDPLPSFPHLSTPNFLASIAHLQTIFTQRAHTQSSWASVQTIQSPDTSYLQITKPLRINLPAPLAAEEEVEVDIDEDDVNHICNPK